MKIGHDFLDMQDAVVIMVFILDGCSVHYGHIWSKKGISICCRHLFTQSSQIRFFVEKDLYYIICAHREMSNYLI